MEILVEDVVEISVKPEFRDIYFPSILHELKGTVWDIDETHIWIKCSLIDMNTSKPYVSGPHRYRLDDIIVRKVS